MKRLSGGAVLACEEYAEKIRNDSSLAFEQKIFLINRSRNYWFRMNKTKYKYGKIKKCKTLTVQVGITNKKKKGFCRPDDILPWNI